MGEWLSQKITYLEVRDMNIKREQGELKIQEKYRRDTKKKRADPEDQANK